MNHLLLLWQRSISYRTALRYPLSALLSITSLNLPRLSCLLLTAIAYHGVRRKFKDLRPMSSARLLENSVTLQALVGDLQMRQHTLLWSWSCCGCCLTQYLQDCHILKVMAPHCHHLPWDWQHQVQYSSS
ncbi:uncharacterized protein LOC135095566 isoform X2 [Scylla paramamosain]|uniref:uncharacterized protein LOC135095566 isoform X2 n=1 Tax=Scylla paramamosain TaxID=85552 RepID=UPI003082D8F6